MVGVCGADLVGPGLAEMRVLQYCIPIQWYNNVNARKDDVKANYGDCTKFTHSGPL